MFCQEEAISFIKDLIEEYQTLMPKMFTHDYYNKKLIVINDPRAGIGGYTGGSVDGSRPSRFAVDATHPTQL